MTPEAQRQELLLQIRAACRSGDVWRYLKLIRAYNRLVKGAGT